MPSKARNNQSDNASLRAFAAKCLAESNPAKKCALVQALSASNRIVGDGIPDRGDPGRPAKPRLVKPRKLPRRQLGTKSGHAAFVHAICHIEFTAINLALDAVVGFDDLPAAFYRDWACVAVEESVHYSLLAEHLQSLGYRYGDFDAHDGLWDMARRTSNDLLRRMALVPRVMEARGLDVTPGMIERLDAIGDAHGVMILKRILNDEIGHVAIGSRWFDYACAREGLEPRATFAALVEEQFGRLRTNAINWDARIAAGFTRDELKALCSEVV